MKLVVISLGLGPEEMTQGAVAKLSGAKHICLRTDQNASASWLQSHAIPFESMDDVYVESGDFDALQDAVADRLLERLQMHREVVYAVADAASDATVARLREKLPNETALEILPGVGLAGRAIAGALEASTQADFSRCTQLPAVDLPRAHWPLEAPLVVLELASPLVAGEVKLRLLDAYAPTHEVIFQVGIGAERVCKRFPLAELDRQEAYDHTASLVVPALPLEQRTRYDAGDLARIMQRLRGPGGCPWDREQTHQTLRPYLLEEAYEAADAIQGGDEAKMADELGDVLLQVVFHAEIGRQHGTFTLTDITSAICRKMIDRHAHIFGDVVCETATDVLKSWDSIKRKERGLRTTAEAMRDVPTSLPALMRAGKVQDKARKVGFDWDDAGQALEKVREETGELAQELAAGDRTAEEGGDLLFAVVNVLRLLKIDPELALHDATEKFLSRFSAMEQQILSENKQMQGMTLQELDVYWEKVKINHA